MVDEDGEGLYLDGKEVGGGSLGVLSCVKKKKGRVLKFGVEDYGGLIG